MVRRVCEPPLKRDLDATQWSLFWQILPTLDAVWKGSSSVRYLSTLKPKLLKQSNIFPIPGLYSGIFVMYLQHQGSQQSTDKAKNILFYALWVLYALSTATIIIDILGFAWPLADAVSMDYHGCLTLFQLVVQNYQNMEIAYHLEIIEVTVFACCDFIAQLILVRMATGNIILSFNLFI